MLLAVQIPIGAIMFYRGNILNLWNEVTDFLYSTHKSLGIVLLLLVVLRALIRLIGGSPPPVGKIAAAPDARARH